MSPADLAKELRISAGVLRGWLRSVYPRGTADEGTPWELTTEQRDAARDRFGPTTQPGRRMLHQTSGNETERPQRDEPYIVDLCDEILDEKALRQHRFDWLRGDPGSDGRRAQLPVDAYYPDHGLVLEYHEAQHTKPVDHFDKPEKVTVSKVNRREQRLLYDKRREVEIPAHGLRLVVVSYEDFATTRAGRLRRDRVADLATLRRLLDSFWRN